MKSFSTLIATALLLALGSAAAFSPAKSSSHRQHAHQQHQSRLFLAVQPPQQAVVPPASILSLTTDTSILPSDGSTMRPIDAGVRCYLGTSSMDTTTSPLTSLTVSLEERKPPTAEEIAAKKRNFNVVFWGGGIVAPFLATFFYFGLKFWER
jgi:hypothetical protein